MENKETIISFKENKLQKMCTRGQAIVTHHIVILKSTSVITTHTVYIYLSKTTSNYSENAELRRVCTYDRGFGWTVGGKRTKTTSSIVKNH